MRASERQRRTARSITQSAPQSRACGTVTVTDDGAEDDDEGISAGALAAIAAVGLVGGAAALTR